MCHIIELWQSSVPLQAARRLSSPDSVKDFLRLQGQGLACEVFAVMYLDAQNQLIEYERLFRGTLTRPRLPARVLPGLEPHQGRAENANPQRRMMRTQA